MTLVPLTVLGISQKPRILSGIQFTRHFIEFVVVETKLFVGSNVNVILTLTCGQRLSRAAGSKKERKQCQPTNTVNCFYPLNIVNCF